MQLIQSRPVPLLNYINAHSIVGAFLLLSLCRFHFHVILCVSVAVFVSFSCHSLCYCQSLLHVAVMFIFFIS